MSLRLSKKTANNTRYDGLVKTLRQESHGHLTGSLIHTVPPTLLENGKKRKVPVPTIASIGHIHIRDNTGKPKKKESLASASVSNSSVAFKRPSENRNAASTSKPPVPTTRKRKHSPPSGPPDKADEDSAPSRRKRLAAESTPSDGHGGQSAPAHALPNRKDRPTTTDLPSHPPLEQIEMWVPTPNAKFGPPKRKRLIGKHQDPPKEIVEFLARYVPDPAKTPVPTPIPLPSSSRPLSLTESQTVALREEEEESQSQSQSQPILNQPGGTINDSATSDPLPPTVRDAKDDTQPTNPNVNNGRGPEPSGQGAYSQSNVPNPIKQVLGTTNDSPGHRFDPLSPSPLAFYNPNPSASAISSLKSPQTKKSVQGEGVNTEDTHRLEPHIPVFNFKPSASAISSSKPPQTKKSVQGEGVNTEDTHHLEPHIPVFNFKPSASAISSSKSPQTEKSAKTGPPRIGKPGTSSIKQHSPSRNEPPRSGNGALANRRAFEARVRLDELRRAGKRFGNIASKGHPTLETPQSSEPPPPHVDFKRVMDGMESPNGSQVTHLGNSANEISASASVGGNRRADPSKSQEGLVINKSGQDANMGSGGVVAANVLVVRGDVAIRRTAPC
jgi:hypothetical protein